MKQVPGEVFEQGSATASQTDSASSRAPLICIRLASQQQELQEQAAAAIYAMEKRRLGYSHVDIVLRAPPSWIAQFYSGTVMDGKCCCSQECSPDHLFRRLGAGRFVPKPLDANRKH